MGGMKVRPSPWRLVGSRVRGAQRRECSFESGMNAFSEPRRAKVSRGWHRDNDRVGEQPRVDYLELFERTYGPKESWHRAEAEFMRKVIPVLARKIDDLRERVADMHRDNRLHREATQEQLQKIPLLKREAWMSPDWTREMLKDDLESMGYTDHEGRLIPAEQLRPAIRERGASHQTPLLSTRPDDDDDDGSTSGGTGGSTPSAPPPTAPPSPPSASAATALAVQENTALVESDPSAAPVVVDPAHTDLYAPDFSPQPVEDPSVLDTRRKFRQLPSPEMMTNLARRHRVADGKLWGEFSSGIIEATVKGGKVVSVKPSEEAKGMYADPTERFAGVRGDERKAEGMEEEGKEEWHGKKAEGEDVDPVMSRLREEKRRHRQHKTDLWKKVGDPIDKPADALHRMVQEMNLKDAAAVPMVSRMAHTAKSLIEADAPPVDLQAHYPAAPERGPDQLDHMFKATQKMSREKAIELTAQRKDIERRLRSPEITGATLVNLLPHHPDQMKFMHKVADDEGVYYTVSANPNRAGRPLDPVRAWPKAGAVKIPFKVHEAAKKDGYEGLRAKELIRKLTTGEPVYDDPLLRASVA